ncbi:hypothetical protein O988_02073 [Pseudogymnoascus sp. VKM F-3808]|nr:hypothetical protein O988_02073 [Pseudogymnoascus sp. VKM F-3808]
MPPEILALIFSCLMRKHIKTARQVCHTFDDIASPYLIDTAIAGSETETLKRLEAIAKHDRFRTAITTVIFSVCSLGCGYATVGDYYAELSWRYRYSKEKIPALDQCEQHWRDYQTIYKDQAECQQGGDDKRRIKNALRHMPNIKHLVISTNAWELASHPLNRLWCPSNYKIIEPRHDPPEGPYQSSHGFHIISSALLSNNLRLCSLSFPEIRNSADGLRSPSFSNKTPALFHYLRKVALYLYGEIYQDLPYQINVQKCLSIAKDLESLEIGSEPAAHRIHFTTLFHTKWPKLIHLRLQINIHYDSFTVFCKNHHESLRSLHLQSIGLFGGTWGDLITEIGKHLRLTDAWLEDLYEGISDDKWTRLDSPVGANIYRLCEAEEGQPGEHFYEQAHPSEDYLGSTKHA